MLKIDPLQRFTLEETNEFIHYIEDELKGFRTILLMDSQAQETLIHKANTLTKTLYRHPT